jgi:hypothetical protein
MPELLCEVSGRRVAGDFIVLHPLRGANQCKICGGVFLLFAFAHNLLAFLNQPHHSPARLGAGRFAQQLKAFFQRLDLAFCLGKMLFKRLAKPVKARRLGHLGKRLNKLLFRMKDVAELVDQQVVQTLRALGR